MSAFYHPEWQSYYRKTEISNYKKSDTDVIITRCVDIFV